MRNISVGKVGYRNERIILEKYKLRLTINAVLCIIYNIYGVQGGELVEKRDDEILV